MKKREEKDIAKEWDFTISFVLLFLIQVPLGEVAFFVGIYLILPNILPLFPGILTYYEETLKSQPDVMYGLIKEWAFVIAFFLAYALSERFHKFLSEQR